MPSLPDDIGLLSRHLELSHGQFSLAFVRWNLGGTEEPGIERVRTAVPELTHVPFDVTEYEPMIFMSMLAAAPPGDVLHLLGLYRHLPDYSEKDNKSPNPMLRVLNMQRELWKIVTRPVVIWLPESCLRLIARHASDFWSWRSGVFELPMSELERLELAHARKWDDSGHYLDIPDAQIPSRIDTLTNLWDELHEDGELPRKQWETAIDIAIQLITLYGHRGDFERRESWRDSSFKLLKQLERDKDMISTRRAAFANLEGNLWLERPIGDRSDNVQHAIMCYLTASQVYTREKYPQQWATTQQNLGNAYAELPTGNKWANLGKAIQHYESALVVRTKADFPQDWAMTLNNLGATYRDFPTGDLGENIGKAIKCYESALMVYTQSRFPQDWAMTQNNLGNAYRELPTGDRGANLARAVVCFKFALEVYTKARFPQDWAMAQSNLGNAYQELPTGDRGENLGIAVSCYEAALEVRTKARFPQDWAMTQNNLGNAYSELPTGDRSSNLGKAVLCYKAALEVLTQAGYPQEWAMTQGNLALVYADWATIESQEVQRNQAIEHISNAIEGFTQCSDEHNYTKHERILAKWLADWKLEK